MAIYARGTRGTAAFPAPRFCARRCACRLQLYDRNGRGPGFPRAESGVHGRATHLSTLLTERIGRGPIFLVQALHGLASVRRPARARVCPRAEAIVLRSHLATHTHRRYNSSRPGDFDCHLPLPKARSNWPRTAAGGASSPNLFRRAFYPVLARSTCNWFAPHHRRPAIRTAVVEALRAVASHRGGRRPVRYVLRFTSDEIGPEGLGRGATTSACPDPDRFCGKAPVGWAVPAGPACLPVRWPRPGIAGDFGLIPAAFLFRNEAAVFGCRRAGTGSHWWVISGWWRGRLVGRREANAFNVRHCAGIFTSPEGLCQLSIAHAITARLAVAFFQAVVRRRPRWRDDRVCRADRRSPLGIVLAHHPRERGRWSRLSGVAGCHVLCDTGWRRASGSSSAYGVDRSPRPDPAAQKGSREAQPHKNGRTQAFHRRAVAGRSQLKRLRR